jgi:hypothetical protein
MKMIATEDPSRPQAVPGNFVAKLDGGFWRLHPLDKPNQKDYNMLYLKK